MKKLFLLLLLINCEIYAQIEFKVPNIEDAIKVASIGTDSITHTINNINFGQSKDLVVALDDKNYNPMSKFYALNPQLFETLIRSKDFNIFLSSFNFNNRSVLSKRSLISQGVIYFLEKKIMFELASKYFDSRTHSFDLVSLENDFFKQLTDKNLHFLISYVEIFEHWHDYNDFMLPNAFATVTEYERDRLKVLVNTYLNKIIDKEFFMYKYVNSSNTFAKSIYIDHGNDIFFLSTIEIET